MILVLWRNKANKHTQSRDSAPHEGPAETEVAQDRFQQRDAHSGDYQSGAGYREGCRGALQHLRDQGWNYRWMDPVDVAGQCTFSQEEVFQMERALDQAQRQAHHKVGRGAEPGQQQG